MGMGVVGSLQYYIALLLGLAALAMEVFALVDALRHRSEAFTAAGKLTKQIWTIILVVAVAIGFVTAQNPLGIGILPVVAAAVYLADVRPALRRISGRGVVRQRLLRLLVTLTSSGPLTSLLDGPDGALEVLTTGSGLPSTVFAHGLAGSIETTRPFGSGVSGSRTFFHFRGHGASAAPESDWTYAALAGELEAVAGHVRATQALGVSMGAGALCALLEREPGPVRAPGARDPGRGRPAAQRRGARPAGRHGAVRRRARRRGDDPAAAGGAARRGPQPARRAGVVPPAGEHPGRHRRLPRAAGAAGRRTALRCRRSWRR